MYTISKCFYFEAAHQLDNLPEDHKCSRIHGHSYIMQVELSSNVLDENGFVVDYADFDGIKLFIKDRIDHRNLNDLMTVPTTAENIAKWFYDWCISHWPQTTAVRISETRKTWAEYRP